MQHLEDAHKAICRAAIVLDRDILQWANFGEIIPVPQYDFTEDLMLWVPGAAPEISSGMARQP